MQTATEAISSADTSPLSNPPEGRSDESSPSQSSHFSDSQAQPKRKRNRLTCNWKDCGHRSGDKAEYESVSFPLDVQHVTDGLCQIDSIEETTRIAQSLDVIGLKRRRGKIYSDMSGIPTKSGRRSINTSLSRVSVRSAARSSREGRMCQGI